MIQSFKDFEYNRPFEANWLLVPLDGYRLIVLTNGNGIECTSTKNVQLIELTDPDGRKLKKRINKRADDFSADVCTVGTRTQQQVCNAGHRDVINSLFEFGYHVYKTAGLGGQNARVFAIIGHQPGSGAIEAFSGSQKVATLDFNVEKTLKIPAVFHIVEHLSGGGQPNTPHSKTINENSIRGAIAHSNKILGLAGIRVFAKLIRTTFIHRYLGPAIEGKSDDAPEVLEIVRHADTTVKVNVFFVGKLINVSGTRGRAYNDKYIIMDDTGIDLHRLLAHELGHIFGLGHTSGVRKSKNPTSTIKGNTIIHNSHERTYNLMAASFEGDISLLNHGQIMNLMRPTARKLLANIR